MRVFAAWDGNPSLSVVVGRLTAVWGKGEERARGRRGGGQGGEGKGGSGPWNSAGSSVRSSAQMNPSYISAQINFLCGGKQNLAFFARKIIWHSEGFIRALFRALFGH